MVDATLELLRELTEAPGISGYEQAVREIIRKNLQEITTIDQDPEGRCDWTHRLETSSYLIRRRTEEASRTEGHVYRCRGHLFSRSQRNGNPSRGSHCADLS